MSIDNAPFCPVCDIFLCFANGIQYVCQMSVDNIAPFCPVCDIEQEEEMQSLSLREVAALLTS